MTDHFYDEDIASDGEDNETGRLVSDRPIVIHNDLEQNINSAVAVLLDLQDKDNEMCTRYTIGLNSVQILRLLELM